MSKKTVIVKNKFRSIKSKMDTETRVPEHVRLDVKPQDWSSFNDDFASAAALRKSKAKKGVPVITEPTAYMDNIPTVVPPIVGHGEQVITEEQTKFDEEILPDEIPSPPIRHRRFVVVEDESGAVEDTKAADESPPFSEMEEEPYMVPRKDSEEPGIADAFQAIGDSGYVIFMGNNFICALSSKDETEEAIELILSTNPPEELIVLKRVGVKIGISIGD